MIKDFREDYKADTDCAVDYEVAECKNGPDEPTDTGAASGGAPQGQGQRPRSHAARRSPRRSPRPSRRWRR